MTDSSTTRRDRARAGWAVLTFRIGDEPSENLSATTTAEERLAMVWPLTVEAWTLAGRSLERLPRSQWPGRILRPSWMPSNRDLST
ncbi:MAG: hypothetical protein AAGC60_26955 [Acidobacteriota bacterium]